MQGWGHVLYNSREGLRLVEPRLAEAGEQKAA
jgi:hypothetical protein